MNAVEIAACIASIIAIGIGILAIWLSIVFYRMTTELSGSTKEAAKDISASVNRLETLFNTLYADTFSMMKETVTDMRKHIWPENVEVGEKISDEVEKRADEKVKGLKEVFDKEVTGLLEMQSRTDAKVENIKGDLEKIFDRVIDQSRRVEIEARQETLREIILRELRFLHKHNESVEAGMLVTRMEQRYPETAGVKVVDEISNMREDGSLSWDGKGLGPKTVLKFK